MCRCFTCALVIGQVDDVLFVLWYFSIYNNLKGKNGKDITEAGKTVVFFFNSGLQLFDEGEGSIRGFVKNAPLQLFTRITLNLCTL